MEKPREGWIAVPVPSIPLSSWRESLEALERDKDRLLESYASLAPEALANLDPEERRTVYSMPELHVVPDGGLKTSGAFGREIAVWETDATSTR